MLEKIAAVKQREVKELHRRLNKDEIIPRKQGFAPISIFRENGPGIRIIAEVKKASPSKGVLCSSFNHCQLARIYETGGAAAISVITDVEFFQGSPAYLADVRNTTEMPLLRKDFIIDEIQLYETVSLGADMVLLIAAMHNYEVLLQLCEKSRRLGLHPLLEIHDRSELEMARDLPVGMVGVNNRNLQDFSVDLKNSLEMAEYLPPDCIKVSESGIHLPEHLALLEKAGFDAVLVGESLVKSDNAAAKLKQFVDYRVTCAHSHMRGVEG